MELDELRKKRLAELSAQNSPGAPEADAQARADEEVIGLLRRHLDDAAFARLTNIRMVNAERYRQFAQSLLYAIQNAHMTRRISDGELKRMMASALPERREIKIKRIQKRDLDG
jgi:DNA-binding TFAR19-related protein (PDSD5 family)